MNRFNKKIQNKADIQIFTDGSCYPNPSKYGAWAYIIKFKSGKPQIKRAGACKEETSTNNRMELMAAIEALSLIKECSFIELVTDSEYLGKGIVYWMDSWCKTNWKQKNSDLWKILYDLVKGHDVYVTCIKGHSGQLENEECDRMAGEVAKSMRENDV